MKQHHFDGWRIQQANVRCRNATQTQRERDHFEGNNTGNVTGDINFEKNRLRCFASPRSVTRDTGSPSSGEDHVVVQLLKTPRKQVQM